ncbi:MAG: hypothetical protein D6767_05195, partial [Candidatus Hydrogenedentota bacterium]
PFFLLSLFLHSFVWIHFIHTDQNSKDTIFLSFKIKSKKSAVNKIPKQSTRSTKQKTNEDKKNYASLSDAESKNIFNAVSAKLRYPERAIRLGVEGDVRTNIFIAEDGSVKKISFSGNPFPDFTEEVKTQILKTKFPKKNKPYQVKLLFRFRLE